MSQKVNRSKSKEVLIEIEGVNKTYQTGAGAYPALKEINLNLYEGEFVGVIGKSGSGKSTLVNMITGIDRPTKGKVYVDGMDIHAMKEGVQARWRGKNMGVVFQFFQLLPMLTLIENVLLPMDFCDVYEPSDRVDRAMDLLRMVGLEGEAQKLPGSVSGGHQQSAAIARALANDPPIIVADEPTGNLDAKTADSVYDTFESLAHAGRTIIMITHDPEIENRLSRKILLSDGEVIDPILIDTFPWLPHPDLKVLGHKLEHVSFVNGEKIDVSGMFSDQLMLIEGGEIQLSFSTETHSAEQVILKPGAYFGGAGIVQKDRLSQFSAKSLADLTSLAILSWDAVLERVEDGEKTVRKIRQKMHAHMLGEERVSKDEGGVIR